jgi:hypothetical protein
MLYPKSIFRFIWPVHVHLKTDKVDFEKSHCEKQVDMNNVVEFLKECFAYFNALEA